MISNRNWGLKACSVLIVCGLIACEPPNDQDDMEISEGGPDGVVEFGICKSQSIVEYDDASIESLYVSMRDDIRIAVDVILPQSLEAGKRIPTVLMMTRYWRAMEGSDISDLQRFFVSRGYAFVSGDSRGTGASFGTWPYHRSPGETEDFGEIIDWIVEQPWSDGKVGGYGSSYTANTSDWFAQNNRSALVAIVPRSPDFDPYTDVYFPGGVPNVAFGKGWGNAVKNMDLNIARGDPPRGIKPVDGEGGPELLTQAVEQRRDVPGVYGALSEIVYRDDVPDTWGASMLDWSIHTRLDDLERSKTPMFSWGGWYDGGTAQGVIARFMSLSNEQKAIIGPWNHGAGHHASPYLPEEHETTPSEDMQMNEALCYFDHYLKGVDNATPTRQLIYYTMGEEAWKTTNTWPPKNSVNQRWFFNSDNRLDLTAPEDADGVDIYEVDFEVTTGKRNRWYTQGNKADVVFPDRAGADEKLLTYTSEPLESDVEITGSPVVRLILSSTTTDSAFHVYLEDVDPQGNVYLLSEGQLRALHRKVSDEEAPYKQFTPYHSFLSKDGELMVAGETETIDIGLHPTSALIREGHRIRIAIAGADKDTFARIPADGPSTWTIERNNILSSYVDLPIIDGKE